MAPTTSPLLKRFCFDALVSYGGPQGTTLLLENVVSFCKNTTVIFRIEHLSLEFCNRSL